MKNLSKLSFDLKNKMQDQFRLQNYTKAQTQNNRERMLRAKFANDQKDQENLNKFVYDLRVNNENRQIQQSKLNIQNFEEKEM